MYDNFTNSEYNILIYPLIISIFLAVTIISLTLMINFQTRVDAEKSSAYECGFNPFSENRNRFEISFYLVSILFIIFDVEILFLFPFSKMGNYLPYSQFLTIFFFLGILILGVIIEIRKNAISF